MVKVGSQGYGCVFSLLTSCHCLPSPMSIIHGNHGRKQNVSLVSGPFAKTEAMVFKRRSNDSLYHYPTYFWKNLCPLFANSTPRIKIYQVTIHKHRSGLTS